MVASLPETMRAAYVERLGPPEAIAVSELAVPIPGPTDVLVAVEQATAEVHARLEAGTVTGRLLVRP